MGILHQLFVLCTASQIIDGHFAKFCDLLRIYKLYIHFHIRGFLFWNNFDSNFQCEFASHSYLILKFNYSPTFTTTFSKVLLEILQRNYHDFFKIINSKGSCHLRYSRFSYLTPTKILDNLYVIFSHHLMIYFELLKM